MRTILVRSGIERADRAAIAAARVPGISRPFGHGGPRIGAPAPGEVLYPRWVPGVGTRMMRTDLRQLPTGWQSISVSIPMRAASCEEVRCPFFLRGWNLVIKPDGSGTTGAAADMTEEQAVATYGLHGAERTRPRLVPREPGTPCGRAHRLPSGLPPLYSVNGRPTLWNEFEDALGGGLHQAARLRAEGTA